MSRMPLTERSYAGHEFCDGYHLCTTEAFSGNLSICLHESGVHSLAFPGKPTAIALCIIGSSLPAAIKGQGAERGGPSIRDKGR